MHVTIFEQIESRLFSKIKGNVHKKVVIVTTNNVPAIFR